MSQGDFVVMGATVEATIVLARADEDALGTEGIAGGVDVDADGEPCAATYGAPRPVGGDGVETRATFACPHAPNVVGVSLPLIDELPAGHAHLLRIATGGTVTTRTVRSGGERVTLVIDANGAPESFARAATRTFALGAAHVATGWDHALFLLALALGERRARSLAVVVTAFTVAHAVALAGAALGLLALDPRLVETAIAATIALVGAENAFARARVPRVVTAFAFGLVHGLGFAGALRALALGSSWLVPALLGFNLGVEGAQLAVAGGFAAALTAARRRGWVDAARERKASLAVAVIGAVLLVGRTVDVVTHM